MNHDIILEKVNVITSSQNHYQLTKFIFENKEILLESSNVDNEKSNIVITNILNLSLYGYFVIEETWQNIITEVNHQYQLHQMIDQTVINYPSPRIMNAVIHAFKLCYGVIVPPYTRRLLTLFSDTQLLILIIHMTITTNTDPHLLKSKGYLNTDDFKKMVDRNSDNNLWMQGLDVQFQMNQGTAVVRFIRGELQGWFLGYPCVHKNKKMIDLMSCYQGMGWVAIVSECVNVDNSRSILVRMDGGSEYYSRTRNETYFTNVNPLTLNLINWSDLLESAMQIISDQPAFNHPNVVSES